MQSRTAIYPLDLRFLDSPEGIAAFLVLGPGGPVLIETGPGSTLPTLERELAHFELFPSDVRDVLVTHIHLDHAGAAGWWARQGANIYVHHIGAPHLADPSRLLASARRIYGDTLEPLWGEVLSAPAERVHPLHDGDVVEAGGLNIVAWETPGHARHHLVYQLGDVAFAGDLGGIRLSGRPHVRLPTPPPEFDLSDWLASITRMRALNFSRIYLTHFGPVDEVDAHWSNVESLLGQYTEMVRQGLAEGLERDAILARFTEWEAAREVANGLDEQARALYAGVGPSGMSVDGLIRYWSKRGLG